MLVNQGINSVSEINYLDKFLAAVVFIAIIESSSQIRGIFPRVGWCGCDGCLCDQERAGESRNADLGSEFDWFHHRALTGVTITIRDQTQHRIVSRQTIKIGINIWRQFSVPKIPNGEIVLDLLVSKFNLVWTKFISPSSFPGRG